MHGTPTATATEAVEAGSAGGGHRTHTSAVVAAAATGDSRAAELTALATAAKGLVQRSRVLSKRLNSLCALHPRLMWELKDGRHLRAGGNETVDRLVFPDPFELGTLEVRSKLPTMFYSRNCALGGVLLCVLLSLW